MILRNEDIKELIAEIPEGHRHLRTTIVLQDDTKIVFQEATVANLVRAYTTIKTHPSINLTVAKSLHNKCGKALLIAEFHDIYRQLRNSLKVNSSNTVIPASEARQESFLKARKDSGQARMTAQGNPTAETVGY